MKEASFQNSRRILLITIVSTNLFDSMIQSTQNLMLLFVIVLKINFGLAKNSTNLQEMTFESALKFSEMRLSSQTQYLFIVFPISTVHPTKNVTELIQRILIEATKDTYFLLSNDLSISNTNNRYQNELLWFPFGIHSYNVTCQNQELTSNFRIKDKNLLFFVEAIKGAISMFESCPIGFDSNVVIYYNENRKNSHRIVFEELYKIDPNQTKLYRNILYKMDLNNEKHKNDISVDFIWNRRRNLHGAIFKGVTEHYPPFVNRIQQGEEEKHSSVVNCEGYLCSILDHLKSHLNFSITTKLPKQRHSWSFLIEEIQKGTYDIGRR